MTGIKLEAADRIEQLVATNEALSISNATLIAERDQNWDSFVHWRKQADDLTGQLAAARDDAKEAEAYAEELEAKLAALVEALERIAGVKGPYNHPFPETYEGYGAFAIVTSRTTLAEIKSGVATTPYRLEGETHE